MWVTAVAAVRRARMVEREWVLTLGYGVLLTLLAAAVRLVAVGDVPFGLHGDEALTGLDAQRVLAEGWIGPYVYPSGLGQPAGPLYWVALVFAVCGASMATLRAAIAVLGIATVTLTYAVALQWFSRPVAVIAAFLLAVMPWHFHLSRTGYMVASWPLVTMAACWLIAHAWRRDAHWGWSALAGLVAGLGVYTYNAYPITFVFYGALFLALLAHERVVAWKLRLLIFWLVVVATASGMVAWAVAHPVEYLTRSRGLLLFNSEPWLAASDWGTRLCLFWTEVDHFVVGLTLGGRPDVGDALSAPGFPPVNPVVTVAAAVGVVMAWRHKRHWPSRVLCAAVAIFPWGALLTVGAGGDYRRTLALAPFLAMLAALPLAAVWRTQRAGWTAALGAGLALVAAVDVLRYPAALATPEGEHVYAPELRLAAEYIATLPPDVQINFFADRWSVHYETLRFLVGDLDQAHNRSREFREEGESAWDGVTPPAVEIFLGRYLPWARRAEDRWPGGHAREFVWGDRVCMRTYQIE